MAAWSVGLFSGLSIRIVQAINSKFELCSSLEGIRPPPDPPVSQEASLAGILACPDSWRNSDSLVLHRGRTFLEPEVLGR